MLPYSYRLHHFTGPQLLSLPKCTGGEQPVCYGENSQYISAILKNPKDSLVDKNTKVEQPAQPRYQGREIFGYHMRTFTTKHAVHLFCTRSHNELPSSSTGRVSIDLPSGFSIYSLLVSRESREGVFQKLYSATIDLQLNRDPAFPYQL